MRLYFLRHGGPVAREAWPGDERLRPLTEEGRRTVERVAEFLADQQVSIDLIVTSPLSRASQTAELVARRLGLTDRLETEERLASGFGPAELAGIVRLHADRDALMLVGHEPDFSNMVGSLIGRGRVACKKASVACVNVPDTATMEGELEWLLPPQLLTP